jgi:hypothetical protein
MVNTVGVAVKDGFTISLEESVMVALVGDN